MASMIIIWGRPSDKEAFIKDYLSSHIPLLESLPGASLVWTEENQRTDRSLVTVVKFDDQTEIKSSLDSESGLKVQENLRRLAVEYTVAAEIIETRALT
jgi:uncharacterized protein (TIGR02118 family)